MSEIPLTPFFTKFILRFSPFNCFKVMCLGYGEDFEQVTELVWKDDKNLDFYDLEVLKIKPSYVMMVEKISYIEPLNFIKFHTSITSPRRS
jgi:hypothetical protein